MRHFDIANRTRNRFTGQMDVTPNEMWTLSASAGVGKDNFDDSYFGLQESSFQTFSLGADFRQPNGFGGGGPTTTSTIPGISDRGRRVPDQHLLRKTIPTATGP